MILLFLIYYIFKPGPKANAAFGNALVRKLENLRAQKKYQQIYTDIHTNSIADSARRLEQHKKRIDFQYKLNSMYDTTYDKKKINKYKLQTKINNYRQKTAPRRQKITSKTKLALKVYKHFENREILSTDIFVNDTNIQKIAYLKNKARDYMLNFYPIKPSSNNLRVKLREYLLRY